MKRVFQLLLLSTLLVGTVNLRAQDGFCMVNGSTTGGTGGTVVTVTNGTDFNTQINIAGPRIIQVQGPINIGRVGTTANKTIIGLGTNALLFGNLNISGVSNVIVRNLRISCPYNDGITIRESGALPGSHHVWIDHCTFVDCGDGSCDISVGADYVTVSWCKFIYPTQLEHQFSMIADGPKDLGPLTAHITLHHNWWSSGADQRMAATSDALVHYYNNYFNCTNNSYCSNARDEAELNIENNFYSGVNNPVGISAGTTGKIKTSGNTYSGCSGTIHPGTDSVFTPSYAYTLDATASVPVIVMAGAGAPGPDIVALPPKIWDGGGANNNLSTANNWGFNETAKQADTLLFAGSTRLTPNNDIAANTQYPSLVFSNNAGAFVIGGNVLNLGHAITDDSAAVQTINLNLDFTYGADHYAMNRQFHVSSPNGSLILNGSVVGFTNIYNRPYAVTKSGPGLLALNGLNSFPGTFSFVGGLVRFNNAGNLGTTNLSFNGGGLQWAAGNTADLSSNLVTIQSNGATFDVGANTVTFTNRIGSNGAGGLTKLGAGTLIFHATNNYKGSTLIADGVLALGLKGLLTNSPQIILSNNAVLDVSARSDGTQILLAGKSLVGNGTVRGSVIAASNSLIAPGFSIGTLVITNALTLQSGCTNLMEISAASHTNDSLVGMTSVSYGGKLIVTNLGGTLAPGDSFKLFSAGSYSGTFTSIALPVLSGNLFWTNRLAANGTIAVVSPVNTSPTNLVVAVVGNALQINWPTDRIGWRLESQTNSLGSGLGTNWATVSGSGVTNQMSFPFNIGNGSVFFRLAYP